MTPEASEARRGPRDAVPAWFRAHRALVDLLLAGVIWLMTGALFGVSYSGLPDSDPGLLTLLVIASAHTLPLTWRRTRPDVSFGIIAVAHVAQLVLTDAPMPSNISVLLSAYAVAAYSRRRPVRQVALLAAALGGALASWDWVSYGQTSVSGHVLLATFYSGLALVCWLWGDLTRKRRELVSRLREQNDALRRDRDQRARLAAQDERTRIAREMHDIVAHSLSVVVVQADGAAYAAAHSADFDREQARRALTTIGTTAREALSETRRLVGVLRTAEDEGGDPTGLVYTPTESLGDLAELVDRVAASGIDVVLEQDVDLATVPRETGLAAYRIVQESLTNVIKHAGPGARVRVLVESARGLRVEVRDDGRGAAASDDGNGHGLIGMRERAVSVGGTMTAGPATGGGYVVAAHLPFDPEDTR
ncbi:sensor histidine kinase [Janibacter sp. Soil728]|uniref:sensor histidine kinase n=1 Tax=Janibacter sp. Soil728 TaxID=1736393 RepID=UPI00138F3AF9|nr:sensor histidine kinase [Janibacter sp. Soil728]